MSNNPSGTNQHGHKAYPADNILKAALESYAQENGGAGLSTEDQLARLWLAFKLRIKDRTLFNLKKRLQVQTVRKQTRSRAEQTQAVITLKSDDPAGLWGVAAVKQRLANMGVMIARDSLRVILHDHFDDEFARRFVGFSKAGILRIPLDALGPNHKSHFDGHEKLNAQALLMGDLAFGIYGGKDSFSAYFHGAMVMPMPNVRTGNAVAHYFLDLVEGSGYKIPITLMTDKGSEVGTMANIHRALRLEFAPEYDLLSWPSIIQLPSVRNTPIEGFWRWKRQGEGHSIKYVLIVGRDAGIFNPTDQLHLDLANWIWPPLIQERLDIFQEYWNTHRISRQAKKNLPSGKSPRQVYLVPESGRHDARDCSIVVSREAVARFRDSIGGRPGRRDAFRFVNDEFQAIADEAYLALDLPKVTLSSVWDIFIILVNHLRPSFPNP